MLIASFWEQVTTGARTGTSSRSSRHQTTATAAATRRRLWRSTKNYRTACTCFARVCLHTLVLITPSCSLQFDPAPRAGEPLVTRRVPDYFLVRFPSRYALSLLLTRSYAVICCHTPAPPAHTSHVSLVQYLSYIRTCSSPVRRPDSKMIPSPCTFDRINCKDACKWLDGQKRCNTGSFSILLWAAVLLPLVARVLPRS